MSLINHYNEAKNKDIIGIDVNLLNDEQKNYYHKFLEKFNIANQTEEELRTIGQNELLSILPKIADFINLCNNKTEADILRNEFKQLGFKDNEKSTMLAMHIIATLTNRCHDISLIRTPTGRCRRNFNVPLEFSQVGRMIEKHCANDETKRENFANSLYKTITPNTKVMEEYSDLIDFYDRMDYKHYTDYHIQDYQYFITNMVQPYLPLNEYVGAPNNKKEMLDVGKYLFNDVLVYPGYDENGNEILLSPKNDMDKILNDTSIKKSIANVCSEDRQEHNITNDEQCL